jgi:predicted nucleotidyltransferase
VLFGSWATGSHTARSDVDLLVVYEGPLRDDVHRLVKQAIGVRGLEPHVYTEEEASALAPTIGRMTRNGIRIR